MKLHFMKHVATIIFAVSMLVPNVAWAIDGDGSSSKPYIISSSSDWSTFRTAVNNRSKKDTKIYAKLTDSFSISSGSYTPVGTSDMPFYGEFNGNGCTINFSGATTSNDNFGLFGYVSNATIKDLKVTGTMTVTGTKNHIGGIVAYLQNASTITGCTFSGTLNAGSSADCIGGIVGFAESSFSGSITNCFCNGTLKTTSTSGERYIGGILGYYNDVNTKKPTIQYNFSDTQFKNSSDDMSSGTYVNGVIGRIRAHADSVLYNTCIANGKVTRAMQSGNTEATIDGSNKPITISVTSGSNGSVSKSYVNPTSLAATKLQVVATPISHYVLDKWTSSSSSNTTISTSTPYSVALSSNVSLYANFKRDSHKISVSSDNTSMGTVAGGGTFTHGTTATLTATPKTGHSFVNWKTGSTKSTENPLSFTVTDDKTYTAYFQANQYTITIKRNYDYRSTISCTLGGQTLTPTMETIDSKECYKYTFNYGDKPVFTVTPAQYCEWSRWADGNTSQSRTYTVTGDATLTANCNKIFYDITLKVNNADYGTVKGSAENSSNSWTSPYTSGKCDAFNKATFTATPNTGYYFVKWTDNHGNTYTTTSAGTGNTCTTAANGVNTLVIGKGNITQKTTYTAYFAPNQYTIKVESNDNTMGTVKGGGKYDYNTQHILTATPNAGHHFAKWSEGTGVAKTDGSNELTITVPASDKDYTATFHKLTSYAAVDADCTTSGNTAYWHCSTCNTYYSDNIGNTAISKDSWIISALNHNFIDYVCSRCDAASGEGTEANPYLIKTKEQLSWFRDGINNNTLSLSSDAKLLNDISLVSSTQWTPIALTATYTGTFDGDGYKIDGLYINNSKKEGSTPGGGLFNNLGSATIKNLTVDGLVSSYGSVGLIAGYCTSNTQFTNCRTKGKVAQTNGDADLGGISGSGGCFDHCLNYAEVNGRNNLGGLSGTNASSIAYCANYGFISGVENSRTAEIEEEYGEDYYEYYGNVGGLVGNSSYTTLSISSSYNVGPVFHGKNNGGLVGYCGTTTPTISGNSAFLEGDDGYTDSPNDIIAFGDMTDNSENIQRFSESEFNSGKVAYFLNGSQSGEGVIWRQNLGGEANNYPVLDATHGVVYYGYTDCTNISYSNTLLSDTPGKHVCEYINGFGTCDVCSNDVYEPAGGKGTSDEPYTIGNAGQLYWFSDKSNEGSDFYYACAELTADIVVNNNVIVDGKFNTAAQSSFREWKPICNSSQYGAKFNGNGHTISGLYNGVGLFTMVSGGTVRDLGVTDSYMDSGLVLSVGYGGTLKNCCFIGKVKYSGIAGNIGNGGYAYNCFSILFDSDGAWGITRSIRSYSDIQNCYTNVANTFQITDSNMSGKNPQAEGNVDFSDGHVVYLLNLSRYVGDYTWRQNLTATGEVPADAHPVLDATHKKVNRLFGQYTNATAVDVNLSKVGSTYLTSLYVDFPCTISGASAYIASSAGDGVMTMSNVGSKIILEGTGLVLQGDAAQATLTVYDWEEDDNYSFDNFSSEGVLKGTTSPITATENQYAFSLNADGYAGFYQWTGKTIPAYKAYYDPKDDKTIEVVISSKGYTMVFDDGETTGLKSISNGQSITNNESDKVYNLNGQKLAKPRRGVNIINGTKVIIK